MKKQPISELLKRALDLMSAHDQVGEVYPEHNSMQALLEEIIEWETKGDVDTWFENEVMDIPILNSLLDEHGFMKLDEK